MKLSDSVKRLYNKSSAFVKKESSFVKASALAFAACAVDSLTTKIVLREHPIYRIIEGNKVTEQLVKTFGLTTGLTLETILTIGLALPVAYAFNKIMREEWRPHEHIAKNIASPNSILKKNILPNILKRDYGTNFFYLLAGSSLWGAYNNVQIYYMMLGLNK